MDEENNKYIMMAGLLILILSVYFLATGIYNLGAKDMCKETGGILLNKDDRFKCVVVENLDLCINFDNIIEDKRNSYMEMEIENGIVQE